MFPHDHLEALPVFGADFPAHGLVGDPLPIVVKPAFASLHDGVSRVLADDGHLGGQRHIDAWSGGIVGRAAWSKCTEQSTERVMVKNRPRCCTPEAL